MRAWDWRDMRVGCSCFGCRRVLKISVIESVVRLRLIVAESAVEGVLKLVERALAASLHASVEAKVAISRFKRLSSLCFLDEVKIWG